jgi:hypothetical protein
MVDGSKFSMFSKDEQSKMGQQSQVIDQNLKNLQNPDVRTILKDKKVTKEIGKQIKASPSSLKAAQKILNDDKKLQQSISKSDPRNKTTKAKPTLKDQLVQAMVHISPQLLGLAIGGAMEGEAGAVAGYKGAIAGQDAAISMQKSQQDLQKGELDIQQKEQNLEAGPEAQQGLTANQRLSGNLRLAELSQKDENRQLREQQGGRRLDLTEEGMRRLNPAQQKEVAKYQEMIPELDRLTELTSMLTKTGPIKGRALDIATSYGWTDLDFTEIQARTANLLLAKLHALSGVAVRQDEKDYIENTIMPSIKDPPEKFAKKLQIYGEMVKRNQQQFHYNLSFYGGQWGYDRQVAPQGSRHQGQQTQIPFSNLIKKPGQAQQQAPQANQQDDNLSDAEIDAQIEQLTKELAE